MDMIVRCTQGYSSADLSAVVKDVAMAPMRDIPHEKIPTIKEEELRDVLASDFAAALEKIKPSVSKKSL